MLVTSWAWALLADPAPYKPTFLPADDPADFSFFFDTGGRRRCYIAPERLCDVPPAGAGREPLRPEMVRRCPQHPFFLPRLRARSAAQRPAFPPPQLLPSLSGKPPFPSPHRTSSRWAA